MRFYFLLLVFFLSLFGCTKKPGVVWKMKSGAAISHSPAISGNRLIIGSNDHFLYALDLKSGGVLWKTDLGERIRMSPLVEGDEIYIGSSAGYFYQIHARDGSIGWKFKTSGMLEFDPCSDSDGIYFGSYDGNFYKLNRQGQVIWKFKTGHQVTSSCVFYKDSVITTSWDANVYSLRRDSGEVIWKFGTGEFNYGNGVIADNSVFYGTHDKIYRIDADSGKMLFEKTAPYNTHMLAFQNFIYTQENGLTKRSLDGEIVGNIQFKTFSQFAPHAVGDNVIAADLNGGLYGISKDLDILWKFRAKDTFWSPGVYSDGIYYIGNRDTHVYALKLPS